MTAKLHSLYIEESEILERSELSRNFWKVRSWSRSRTFHLRLRNVANNQVLSTKSKTWWRSDRNI